MTIIRGLYRPNMFYKLNTFFSSFVPILIIFDTFEQLDYQQNNENKKKRKITDSNIISSFSIASNLFNNRLATLVSNHITATAHSRSYYYFYYK